MEIFIFARFHARPGLEGEVEEALREVAEPTRAEPGCLRFNLFRAAGDPALFFVHSRWRDEAAFELHAGLPHTRRMIERVEPRIDHPLEVVRTAMIA